MAKVVALVAYALCLLALSGFASAADNKKDSKFTIEGKVYCDPCRVQFVTKLSQFLEGADVVLLCKNVETGNVTYSVNGKSGKDGSYTLKAEGDHGNDVCEVKVATSPQPDTCGEAMDETALVTLTDIESNSDIRYANYIGFMKKDPDAECTKVLEELGIYPNDPDEDVAAQDPPPNEGSAPVIPAPEGSVLEELALPED
ncbi:anther-specific protein LAT52-like [Cornus florida]|uniref:anther-specific protein LAT52-like n=1 Tax=Cornus florida TaxID=4283 RepID=UPI00289BA33C|nr:anther-specific protein LAT52-like [Cornus florida]